VSYSTKHRFVQDQTPLGTSICFLVLSGTIGCYPLFARRIQWFDEHVRLPTAYWNPKAIVLWLLVCYQYLRDNSSNSRCWRE